MSPSGARLACCEVTVRFGGVVAVDNVDLRVPPATIAGLVGPNGAGKSTLFGAFSGLVRPSKGAVYLDDVDVTDASPQARAARGLARTFQHPELFGGLSVRDHLVLAHRAKRAKARILADAFTMGSVRPGSAAERESVTGLLGMLGLAGLASRTAVGLPLGVCRLLELGRALASDPTVLLLDEPSSGLDSAETRQFETVVRRVVNERGISVLLVEHDVELVMRLCSHINVLDFGRLIATGSPSQIRADPAVRAAYLGEERTTYVTSGDPRGEIPDEPDAPARPALRVSEVVDAEVSEGQAEEVPDALLSVSGLSVRYGDVAALTDISFSLKAGGALAVLGSNGAGKSSLARAISGLVPASEGQVRFAGRSIVARSAHKIRLAGLVHLPEGRGVFRGLSVIDNLRMAAQATGHRASRHEAVALALDIFPALAARRRQDAGLLSGGEQQMLSLARALATAPRLVIADEMSLGLAPKTVDLVFESLQRAREAGVAVIMIEQYVHRALAFADECLVLQRGAVAWHGDTDSAQSEVLRHYLGEAMSVAT